MLYFIFGLFVLSNVVLEGNWPDTYSSDEAIEFINQVLPEFKETALKKIQSVEKQSIDTIINVLNDTIPEYELGMLNYLLRTKYFNPSAVCNQRKLNRKVKLPFYGVYHNNSKTLPDSTNFHFKYMSALNKFDSPIDKLNFLTEVSANFSIYAPIINDIPEDVLLREEMKKKKFNTGTSYILLNGRQISINELDISSAMVQEYKMKRISQNLGLTDEQFSRHSTMSYYNKYVRTYARAPPSDASSTLYDPASKHYNKPKRENFDFSSNSNFMNTPKKMVEINMIIFLDDPESLGMLRLAFDLEKKSENYLLKIHPTVRNLNDTKQLQIVTAFYHVAFTVSSRNCVDFIFDIMNGMKPEKAYKKTTPNDKYKDVLKLKDDDAAVHAVHKIYNYTQEMNITQSTALINNVFISQKPFMMTFLDELEGQINELKKFAKAGIFKMNDNVDEFLSNNSIHIKGMYPPLNLNDERFVFEFDDSTHIEISEAIEKILKSEKIINENNETLPVAVTYGYDTNVNATAVIHQEEIPEVVKKVFRLDSKKATIIPPFVFDRQLTDDEIDYACKVVQKTYMIYFNTSSLVERTFALFWRGDNHVKKAWRFNVKPENAIIDINKEHPLQFIAEQSPLSDSAPQTFIPLSKIVKYGAGGVKYSCVWPTTNGNFVGESLWFMYTVPSDDCIVQANNFNMIVYPSESIGVSRVGETSFLVTNLFAEGLALKGQGNVVDVKDKQYYVLSNGFCIIPAAPGVYSSFKMDRFEFHRIYPTRTVLNKTKMNIDETAFLITTKTPHPSHNYGLNSMRSALSLRIPVFTQKPEDYPFIPLPNFVPRFLDRKEDPSLWPFQKFIFSNLIFPTSVKHVIISDNDVQWLDDLYYVCNSDMKDNAMIISSVTSRKLSKERQKEINRRNGRPLISGAAFIIDINKFHEMNGGNYMFDVVRMHQKAGGLHGKRGNNIMTLMQFYVQSLIVEAEIGVQRGLSNGLEYHNAISRVWQVYDSDPAPRDYL